VSNTKTIRAAVTVVLIVACLGIWPAVVNGGPFYMADTPSYFRAAASAAFKVFGIKTAWLQEYFRLYANVPRIAQFSSNSNASEIPVTLSGRSIYYGFLLFMGYLAGSTWIVVVFQSLLTAISIYLTILLICRAQGRAISLGAALAIGAAIALLTSASFSISYLMPSVFTGLGLMAVSNLLFLWRWQLRPEKWFWCAVLGYSVLVHSTNLLLFTALVIVALIAGILGSIRFAAVQVISVLMCLTVGILGQAAFSHAVKVSTGAPPVRPPFVATRLIADGPGYAYLRRHCTSEPYIYCRVLRQTHPYSDDLLWSKDPQVSLFRGLTPAEQRISAAQETAFVRAVAAEFPIQVFASAAKNSFLQLIRLDLAVYNYSDGNRERFGETMPTSVLASMVPTRAWNETMPVSATEITSAILALASSIYLIVFSARSTNPRSLRAYTLSMLFVIVFNAVVCGALSGPKGRYSNRIVWVLPAVAGALLIRRRKASSSEKEPAAVPRNSEIAAMR